MATEMKSDELRLTFDSLVFSTADIERGQFVDIQTVRSNGPALSQLATPVHGLGQSLDGEVTIQGS